MKKNSLHSLILIALVSSLTAGCTSATPRFYLLTPTAVAGTAAPTDCSVAVGPVSIPADADRPQMTLQISSNRVEIEEFNRWAAPLNENIAHVVARNLAVLLGTPRVAASRLANFNPTYRVSIDFQQFASVKNQATLADTALVEAVWVVGIPAHGTMRTGRSIVSEPAQGDSFEALAAAHSRALARVSGDIAGAILTEVTGSREP